MKVMKESDDCISMKQICNSNQLFYLLKVKLDEDFSFVVYKVVLLLCGKVSSYLISHGTPYYHQGLCFGYLFTHGAMLPVWSIAV